MLQSKTEKEKRKIQSTYLCIEPCSYYDQLAKFKEFFPTNKLNHGEGLWEEFS